MNTSVRNMFEQTFTYDDTPAATPEYVEVSTCDNCGHNIIDIDICAMTIDKKTLCYKCSGVCDCGAKGSTRYFNAPMENFRCDNCYCMSPTEGIDWKYPIKRAYSMIFKWHEFDDIKYSVSPSDNGYYYIYYSNHSDRELMDFSYNESTGHIIRYNRYGHCYSDDIIYDVGFHLKIDRQN